MGKPQFEESWRELFDGAESEVSDSTWSKIEMDLVRAENTGQRRSIIFYRRLAAGVALVAGLLASYITYDQLYSDDATAIAEVADAKEDGTGTPTLSESESTGQNESISEQRSGKELNSVGEEKKEVPGNQLALNSTQRGPSKAVQGSGSAVPIAASDNEVVSDSKNASYVALIFEPRDFVPQIPESEVSIKSKKFYEPNFPRKLPAMPSYFMADADDDKTSDVLWAAIGFAGGSYNPVESASGLTSTPNQLQPQTSFGSATPQSIQANVGVAYSAGVTIGKYLKDRWVLQGGVGYMTQQIDYTSNYISAAQGQFANNLSKSSNQLEASVFDYSVTAAAVAITSPYTIRSANEYVSIPLQAGYKILDRKLGVQVNTGLATDIFLKNTLKDQSGQAETFEQSAGEGSPYRTVNWSGLAGIEVSHKIASHYQFALIPGFRYTFTSILKNENVVRRNPLVMDVGVRLKYIFN